MNEKENGAMKPPSSEYHRRPASDAPVIEPRSSNIYMDREAVIDGDVILVGSIIPEYYSLKKLWEDIKDVCYNQPIRHTTGVRFDVMFPWESNNVTLCTGQKQICKILEKAFLSENAHP